MSKSDKLERLESLLDQINEIYPEMDRIIIEDPENPAYIMISNQEFLETIMEYFGEDKETGRLFQTFFFNTEY